MTKKKLLVVGCARSGTAFATEFFRRLGLDVWHERLGEDGGVGWPLAIDPNLDEFEHVIHQVRNPIRSIKSLGVLRQVFWNQTTGVVGDLGEGLEKYINYLLRWNERCESMAEFTYRVEDLKPGTETVKRILAMLELEEGIVPEPRTNINSYRRLGRRNYRKTPEEMREEQPELYEEMKNMAERYGYETSWI